MVGVPGRSKGCNTCRQRRVKCTEEKPVCSRCTRGGFQCRGYVRETVWHHLTTEASSTTTASSSPPPPATLGRLVVVERQKPDSTATSKGKAKAPAPAPALGVPSQVSLVGFRQDLCFAYIFSNFVWRGYGASWLHQSAQGQLGALAFDAVSSLAEISFGRAQKAAETEIRGRVTYGKVLRLMVDRLGSNIEGRKGRLWELVVPILLLLMHNTTLTNQSATLFHLRAMSQILAACGPQMFLHQPLRDAFEAARATLVVGSLITRKRVFMDTPAWCMGPYALVPQAKEPQSYLLDILGAVPGFLEELDELEQTRLNGQSAASSYNATPGSSEDGAPNVTNPSISSSVAPRSSIIDRVVVKLEALFVWRLHWQLAFGSDVCIDPDAQNSSQEPPDPSANHLGKKLRFSRPGAAADIALYNAVLMWLLALINELEPVGAQLIVPTCAYQALASMSDAKFAFSSGLATGLTELPSLEPLMDIGSTTRVRDVALEICRIFEWQSVNHTANSWETNFVYLFPIGLALCVFDKEPEIHGWIRTMLNANPLTSGYGSSSAADNGSLHYANSTGRALLIEKGNGETAGSLEAETGMLRQLLGFGWYVSREMAESETSREKPDQNLVHLLILRGRMDVLS
ncbi:hypothetical protein ONZ43_g2156 [Nemania bipapillata]|uniref:Uncharacterized protein n=1 Tax=Nemania bipapillata TaxID=110536 RepID=A0ACC2J1P7_9PEZI|nr:hypothetical protein ONZ43_g2156 [Nemania bipapillata]